MTFHQRRKVPALQCPVVMGRTEIEPSVQENHVAIVRTPDNKADAAFLDPIKTARRTSYSLLGLGMRRMSQVHPSTFLKLLSSYLQPSLTYGFETLRTTPQNLLKMETFYRGILRRMQHLLNKTAGCALHILLGTLPLEAHLDRQVLSLFARLLHLLDSIEQEILCRQLSMKDIDSASWTQKVRTLLKKYSLPSAYDMLASPPKKKQWKQQLKRCITLYWSSKIIHESSSKKTLSHLNAEAYNPGTLHPVWDTAKRNADEVVKAQVKARILKWAATSSVLTKQSLRVQIQHVTYVTTPRRTWSISSSGAQPYFQ